MGHTPTNEALKRRYSKWSNEDLIEAVTLKSEEYMPSAIEVMRSVLRSRGVAESEVSNPEKDHENEAVRLSGVRGWLVVFILFVAVSALLQLWTAANLDQSSGSLVSGSVMSRFLPSFLSLLLLAAGIYGGYATLLLVRKRPRAPVHAQAWLVLTLFIIVISAVLVFVTLGDVPWGSVFSIIHVALWSSYLHESERVATVYGVS